MAFRFKDLMIQVVGPGSGEGDPVCTLATRDDPDPAAVPCTLATMDPARIVPCTLATKDTDELRPCTLATMIPPTPGIRGNEPGCTLATKILLGPAGGTAAAITTVTTVTTVTTLVAGAGGGATDLRTLKEQLRKALEELERQEAAGAQGAGLPATAEEADDLERRLKEAIQELQDHKKALRKSGAKGKK